MRAVVRLLTVAALVAPLASLVARAEYYPQLADGYALLPVSPTEAALSTDDGLLAAARLVLGPGPVIYGIVELQPGLARHFALAEGVLTESRITGGSPSAEPVSYHYDDGRVVLAFAGAPADYSPEALLFTAITVWLGSDGSLEALAHHSVDSEFVNEAVVMDLTGDGVLEVVIPWATGAGGGGAVDVVTLVPTGGLSGFGPELDNFSLYTRSGGMALADLDRDGDWEIQGSAPLLCSACGYDIGFIYTYDQDHWEWVDGEAQFPDFYAAQREFYRQLLAAVHSFVANPAAYEDTSVPIDDYRRYRVTIKGVEHSLAPFAPDDSGSFASAGIWIEALEDYVSSWP